MQTFTKLEPTSAGILTFELSASFLGPPYLGHCGVVYSGSYKTALVTFALEYVSNSDPGYWLRDSLTQRLIAFFENGISTAQPEITSLAIPGENINRVLNNTPTFVWSYFTSGAAEQDSAEIEVGSDDDWSVAELWDPTTLVGPDTSVVYAGASLTDGSTAYVRLRTHNGLQWSEWYQAAFHFNAPPATPTLVSPAHNELVVGLPSYLTAQSQTDVDGDPITYIFGVYLDSLATQQEFLAARTSPSADLTNFNLAENRRHWWKMRATDGVEYSGWSDTRSFILDQYPQAPTSPGALQPDVPTGLPLFNMKLTFQWSASEDTDPLDTVRYEVQLSTEPTFAAPISSGNLLTVTYQFADSLKFGTHYWWRVLARDRGGRMSNSAVASFWTWFLGDIDHSHICDLTDLSTMVAYLSGNASLISPRFLGDITGDCVIDLSDLSTIVAYLSTPGIKLKPGC